jgi:hypothetical protein
MKAWMKSEQKSARNILSIQNSSLREFLLLKERKVYNVLKNRMKTVHHYYMLWLIWICQMLPQDKVSYYVKSCQIEFENLWKKPEAPILNKKFKKEKQIINQIMKQKLRI